MGDRGQDVFISEPDARDIIERELGNCARHRRSEAGVGPATVLGQLSTGRPMGPHRMH